jgi:hypothetical protein
VGYLEYQAERTAVVGAIGLVGIVLRIILFFTIAVVLSIGVGVWAAVRAARGKLTARGRWLVVVGVAAMGMAATGFGVLLVHDTSGPLPWLALAGYVTGTFSCLVGGRSVVRHRTTIALQVWEPLLDLDRQSVSTRSAKPICSSLRMRHESRAGTRCESMSC